MEKIGHWGWAFGLYPLSLVSRALSVVSWWLRSFFHCGEKVDYNTHSLSPCHSTSGLMSSHLYSKGLNTMTCGALPGTGIT